MSFRLDDTIAAVASPPGPAVRGIVRISGADVVSPLNQLLEESLPPHTLPRRIEARIIADELGSPLPVAVLMWPTQRSYTGQPMVEIHCIGSPPILELVLQALFAHGVRPAERGEFTMRAFLHGRMNLVQAEAVVGVIDAADHEELQTALAQLGGGLTTQLHDVRSTIVSILGDLEAGLDFVEEDIEFISTDEIINRLTTCASVLDHLCADSQERLPSGYQPRVVIAGLPNAGKSTLFNALVGEEISIPSAVAGTTRDFLSGTTNIEGTTVEFIDTAGRESARNTIEQTARQLTNKQLESTDLMVWCRAADLPTQQQQQDQELFDELRQRVPLSLLILTCVDRLDGDHPRTSTVAVSVKNGTGLDLFRDQIAKLLQKSHSGRQQLLATTSTRCRESLRRTHKAIQSAIETAHDQLGDEVTAISLREALQELRAILGETWTDDILDHIFSSFCIGK